MLARYKRTSTEHCLLSSWSCGFCVGIPDSPCRRTSASVCDLRQEPTCCHTSNQVVEPICLDFRTLKKLDSHKCQSVNKAYTTLDPSSTLHKTCRKPKCISVLEAGDRSDHEICMLARLSRAIQVSNYCIITTLKFFALVSRLGFSPLSPKGVRLSLQRYDLIVI